MIKINGLYYYNGLVFKSLASVAEYLYLTLNNKQIKGMADYV